LERRRLAGAPDLVVAGALRQELDRDLAKSGRSSLRVWMVACLDSRGTVARSFSVGGAGELAYDAERALASWQFKPFTVAGHAFPAAAVVALDYPKTKAAAPG